ncbi:MAG: hypothetical protein Kow0020_16100 [Wenzhouxiangellaceae bacterium]
MPTLDLTLAAGSHPPQSPRRFGWLRLAGAAVVIAALGVGLWWWMPWSAGPSAPVDERAAQTVVGPADRENIQGVPDIPAAGAESAQKSPVARTTGEGVRSQGGARTVTNAPGADAEPGPATTPPVAAAETAGVATRQPSQAGAEQGELTEGSETPAVARAAPAAGVGESEAQTPTVPPGAPGDRARSEGVQTPSVTTKTAAAAPRPAHETTGNAGRGSVVVSEAAPEARDPELVGVIRPWELPEGLRAEFPPLKIAVHFYAPDASDRFVLIDGERYAQGAALPGGARLERILKRGIIVGFRNYRVLVE